MAKSVNDPNARRENNLKRKRSDEDATGDKEQLNGDKLAKDGKSHNFGPLK
mgnify:CR=1 FL=1